MSNLNEKLELIKQARDDIQDALAEKGQIVGKDIRDYANIISQIKGDVKLFDTIEHMQQDLTAQLDDLAIVYRSELQNINENSEFDKCIFPNEVVLEEVFSNYIYGGFQSVGQVYFEGNLQMSSSMFRFSGYGNTVNINIIYTSSDGITYTRTDGGEELQEFGTEIRWENYGGPFNSVIGNFMKIGGNYFEGLYQYNTQKVKYKYNTALSNKILTIDFVNPSGYSDMTSQNHTIIPITIENNVIKEWYIITYNGSITNKHLKLDLINNNLYFNFDESGAVCATIHQYSNGAYAEKIDVNYQTPNEDMLLFNASLLNDICSTVPLYNMQNEEVYSGENATSFTQYWIINTQLDAITDDVLNKTFYGKNGVETGSLQNLTNLTVEQLRTKVNLWKNFNNGVFSLKNNITSAQNLFKDIATGLTTIPPINISNLTDLTYTFASCTDLEKLPLLDTSNVTIMERTFSNCSSLTTIPLLDTSSVTKMQYTFSGCTSLTNVPSLDTSNALTVSGLFYGCTSLTTIPLLDFSNSTNFSYMFSQCTNLTSVPLLDTSKATTVESMFYHCSSLTSVPQIDVSSSLVFNNMFYNCTSLITIPVLNISKGEYLYNMFYGCTSLNTTSLNNIMQMCIGATSYSGTKTLKYLGLSQTQATTCQGLSNYQAFTNAGWSTGY